MPCVNVYAVTRRYGGPEEGGWWWNCYEPVAYANNLTDKQAEDIKDRFKDIYQEHAEGDIYSSNGGVEIHVAIEDKPEQSATRERPRYE